MPERVEDCCLPVPKYISMTTLRLAARNWALTLGLSLLFALFVHVILACIRVDGGHISYTQDDAYIHMAMAKNLVRHGVWGVTKYEFSSSSSSPFWTLLIAASYLVFGVNEVSALLLNIIFAMLTIIAVYLMLKKWNVPPHCSVLILLGIIFAVPIVTLALSGLEHVMHTFFTVLFIYLAATELSVKKAPATLRQRLPLIIASALLTASRYEGVFAVSAVCLLLLIRKRWALSLLVAAAGALPVLICGFIATRHGWYWLPNSIMVKAHVNNAFSFGGIIDRISLAAAQLWSAKQLLTLSFAAGLIFTGRLVKNRKFWDKGQVCLLIFLAMSILQVVLAKTGMFAFSRYDSYLIATGLAAVGVAVFSFPPDQKAHKTGLWSISKFAFVFLIVGIVAWTRGIPLLLSTPLATNNIFSQQYQMGLFVKENYQGKTVALNDIGAVNYLADVRCLDLVGLSSKDVADIVLSDRPSYSAIQQLIVDKKVDIAIVYDTWFPSDMFDKWAMAGQWRIPDNLVCGQNKVSFYAVGPNSLPELNRALKQFRKQLPAWDETIW